MGTAFAAFRPQSTEDVKQAVKACAENNVPIKRDGMIRELGPDVCAVQQAVKNTLDPLNLFNPGKA